MKTIRALAFALAALAIISCKKDGIIDSLTQFTFSTDYVISVPPSPSTMFPISTVTQPIATTSEIPYSENKTRADMVEKIRLQELELSVLEPDGGTFKFLKSVTIHAMADGLPEVMVAHTDQVPDDVGSKFKLGTTNVELKEYFAKSRYRLRITVTTDEPVTEDYAVNAHAVFWVDAKVLE